jgi:hypothetical protein
MRAGANPHDLRADIGHTDAALTLKVYVQETGRSDEEKAALRALVDGPESAAIGIPARIEGDAASLREAA